MSLKEKLEAKAAGFAKQVPEQTRAIMKRGTAAVAESLAGRKIPSVGDPLPPFVLPDSQGNSVSSRELVTGGPLVVTFFRGDW